MTRAAWVLALFPLLLGVPSACSKFGESGTGGETTDAGDVPDTSTADTGGGPLEHRIFVFGGVTQPPVLSVTKGYVSTVAANGDLGPWTPAPALDDDRYAAAWTQNGDALLAAAGAVHGKAFSTDGLRGALPADPAGATATAWNKAASLATGRNYASAVARQTSIYVSGGRNDTIALGNVERYDTAHDTWSPAGALAAGVAGHATFLRNSLMYVVGGDQLGSGGLTASVKRAGFAETDGSLLPFDTAGDLKMPLAHHSIALVEPWLFVIGGDGTGGKALATVARGTFDGAGMLSWELIAPLPVPASQTGLAEACTVVIDRTIYVMGGRDAATAASKGDVYIGRVDTNGVITWTKSPNVFSEGRAAFGCAVSPSSAQ